ncbi:MAG: LD-carboxypeptidase [bacterium]
MSPPPSLRKAPPLRPGDTIGVAAPASCFDREAFLQGVARLEALGFRVRYREDIFSKKRFLAGDDARRFAELKEWLLDDRVRAIFTARGGYGSMRLLPLLESLPNDLPPKILMGYSDITSLLNFAQQRWGWVTFQGPVVAKDIGERMAPPGQASLLRSLCDPAPLGALQPEGLVTLHPGRAEGRLLGGCLSLIVCSLGTPYQLKTEGGILYLEDVGEKLYSIDRMLTHLRLAGLLQGVRGIVFGPLKDAHDQPSVIMDLLLDLLADLQVPIVFGFPSGHIEDSWTIPFGVRVTLDADRPALIFAEGALAGG